MLGIQIVFANNVFLSNQWVLQYCYYNQSLLTHDPSGLWFQKEEYYTTIIIASMKNHCSFMFRIVYDGSNIWGEDGVLFAKSIISFRGQIFSKTVVTISPKRKKT